jgi:hypothetical protein
MGTTIPTVMIKKTCLGRPLAEKKGTMVNTVPKRTDPRANNMGAWIIN